MNAVTQADPVDLIRGGLILPEHKEASTQSPIQWLDLPERLILPLQQHTGAAASARCRPGQRVLKNQRLTNDGERRSTPLHAPTSGIVRAIERHPIPAADRLEAPCIFLEPDGRDEVREPPACPDPLTRDPDAVIDAIRQAGIVGLGGAVFPTHTKIRNTLLRGRPHTLIVNGAECEPYITCDDRLMRAHAHQVISGTRILLHAVRAAQALIGIEENKAEAIAAMETAIAAADLGERVRIVAVPTIYPSGGERQLIKLLTGEEVPAQGLPPDIGMICVNVGTAAATHRALRAGVPLTRRVVTLTGSGLRRPMNVLAPIGTPIADLIQAAGGYTDQAARLIMGGPMMGFALPGDHLPLMKSTNCIIAAAQGELARPGPILPCIRCGDCARVCPMDLLPQQLYWYARAQDFDRTEEDRLFDCIECGACAYVCPSRIPLVAYYRDAKNEIRTAQRAAEKADQARRRFEARNQRLERDRAERDARRRAAGKRTDKQAEIAAALTRSKAKKTRPPNP